MRPHSLRIRLALMQAGILAAAVIVISAFTLWLLRESLNSRMDAGLLSYARRTAAIVASDIRDKGAPWRGRWSRQIDQDPQEWAREVQIVSARTGEVLACTDGLMDRRIPLSRRAVQRAALGQSERGRETFETRKDMGSEPVRVVTVPVRLGDKTPLLVQAATSIEGVEEAILHVAEVLLFLAPIVVLLSFLGGRALVGRSLRTVDAITQTALAIKPDSLDQRVSPIGSDDEIARLASAFNEMIARLDRGFMRIRRFSANASHELRTPLTTIRGTAEVALMGERPPDEYRQALASIVEEAERMAAIVDNLLLMARADAGQVDMKRERVAVHDVVASVYEQAEAEAHRRGVTIDIPQMDDAHVTGDALWVRQTVSNILANAVKFTPPGGIVTLSVVERGGEARLSIRDTGPGISEEHLPRVFDRFYQVNHDMGGAGLGLHIAAWAAGELGGRIDVESELGKGSTFTLVLPSA